MNSIDEIIPQDIQNKLKAEMVSSLATTMSLAMFGEFIKDKEPDFLETFLENWSSTAKNGITDKMGATAEIPTHIADAISEFANVMCDEVTGEVLAGIQEQG